MNEVLIDVHEDGKGLFSLDLGYNVTAQIKCHLNDGELVVLDTVVSDKRNLNWMGSWILDEIVEYARMH